MIYLERVAEEIKSVGLYDLVLQDVQKIAGKQVLDTTQIMQILQTHPEILDAYKQTNLEYNISNIHIKDISLETVEDEAKTLASKVNEKLTLLREIEKYTLDFEQSSVLVIIMSIEFFVLFSVQYFIVLLNLKNWQWEIYGLFALSVLAAWQYARKEKRLFTCNAAIFQRAYQETVHLLDEMENKGYIRKEDLMIRTCDEHI